MDRIFRCQRHGRRSAALHFGFGDLRPRREQRSRAPLGKTPLEQGARRLGPLRLAPRTAYHHHQPAPITLCRAEEIVTCFVGESCLDAVCALDHAGHRIVAVKHAIVPLERRVP